jgi:hypothetical protein
MNEQERWAEAINFLKRVDAVYEKVLTFLKNSDRSKLNPAEQQESAKLVQKITRLRTNIARRLQPLQRRADINQKLESLAFSDVRERGLKTMPSKMTPERIEKLQKADRLKLTRKRPTKKRARPPGKRDSPRRGGRGTGR